MSQQGSPPDPKDRPLSTYDAGTPARAPRTLSAPPALLIFAGALLLAMATFGSSVALLMRSSTLDSAERTVVTTAAPTRTATPAPAPVRVAAAAGTAERTQSGAYQVMFLWTLDGAREGDTALLRFSVGTRVVSEQRGALDATVFTASTGRFVVTTSQECSTEGWSAEVVSVRGLTPVGDATSRVAGATCR